MQIDLEVLFLVLRRRTPEKFFKTAAEMRLVAEAGPLGDFADSAGIVRQQAGCKVKAQFSDQLASGPPNQGIELAVELGNAQVHLFSQAFDTEIFVAEVAEDVFVHFFQEKAIAGRNFGGLLLGRKDSRPNRWFREGGSFLHGLGAFLVSLNNVGL